MSINVTVSFATLVVSCARMNARVCSGCFIPSGFLLVRSLVCGFLVCWRFVSRFRGLIAWRFIFGGLVGWLGGFVSWRFIFGWFIGWLGRFVFGCLVGWLGGFVTSI
jgi:hypothetical protein